MKKNIILVPEKSSLVSLDQIRAIMERTPERHKYRRPAKGGGEWEYVTGVYAKKTLNRVFGFNWDFVVKEHGKEGDCIWVLGELKVYDMKGNVRIKNQFGRADIKYKKDTKNYLDFGNDLKAATTDALKKCMADMGFFSDVYGKNEFRDIGFDEIYDKLGGLPEPEQKKVKIIKTKKGAKKVLEAKFKEVK